MLKSKLYIIDNLFSHAHSSSWYNKPKLFEWVRGIGDDHVILTDNSLTMVDSIVGVKKYGWLLESPKITPHAYEFIKNNYNKFDNVFTFSKELLDLSDKFVLIPVGGCWIKDEERVIHNKTKNLSIILSAKKNTEGHKLRHSIVSSNVFNEIDIFGYNNPIENKITALKAYRFSIIIENTKSDYYFTEKLIDCLITGTIPIYWGCPSISDFFDINGMITFNDIDELLNVKNYLTEELYNSKIEHINNNYQLAKNYLVADDLIYKILKK